MNQIDAITPKEAPVTDAEGSPLRRVSNKDLCGWFFVETGDNLFHCKHCDKKDVKRNDGGWGNLIAHLGREYCFDFTVVKQSHPKYEEFMKKVWKANYDEKASLWFVLPSDFKQGQEDFCLD